MKRRGGCGHDAGGIVVGSLASCVGCFVGRFCARHDISREGLKVEAEWTMAEGPHRVGQILLAIRLPHRVTPEQKERLLKVAYGHGASINCDFGEDRDRLESP